MRPRIRRAWRNFFADCELGCESHRAMPRRLAPKVSGPTWTGHGFDNSRVVAELGETPARFSTYAPAC